MNDKLIRLSQIIRQEIATILLRRMNDVRIGFVSITNVEITPDLRYAKVFYSQFGNDSEKKKTQKALNRAKSFIKFEVGKAINLRVTPDLNFIYDHSLEHGCRLIEKIKNLDNEPS